MKDQSKRAGELLDRYLKGKCTPEEKRIVESVYRQYANNNPFEKNDIDFTQRGEESWRYIQSEIQNKTTRLWSRLAAAASLLLFLSVSGYFVTHRHQQQSNQIARVQNHDIAPGHDQATLTLADGRKIVLKKGMNGQLAVQGSTAINVNQNTITYNGNNTGAVLTTQYNTLSTKKGEASPYPLELADGTKVWLNASSSITFPTAFNKNIREVTMTGEVYFEVKHNDKLPFRVKTDGQTIQDIGTAFDVNAYEDEPSVQTTLLEGSVKVIKGTTAETLQPGQQAVTKPGDNNINIKSADVGSVMAWKNGLFHFDHVPFQVAMRQIARWYDVDVVYEGAIPKTVINGEAYRNMKISQVFEMLSYLKVKFRVEGKKIIVTNK